MLRHINSGVRTQSPKYYTLDLEWQCHLPLDGKIKGIMPNFELFTIVPLTFFFYIKMPIQIICSVHIPVKNLRRNPFLV